MEKIGWVRKKIGRGVHVKEWLSCTWRRMPAEKYMETNGLEIQRDDRVRGIRR